ncbi:unnamed protein product [Peronospora belbahrii]|uniref:Complex 1 LYR protein domain-containing protein n=1 Tax=Peronospora belbahrii TaxID=622444 RepID=A0AAU9L007_9STRA|nr:unnamed protein product [Peronospora belbahrii]CAH0519460.1 unnamed protein product [Peronospora belbahrii]
MRMETLRLYRAIYRAAGKMPTRDRTNYVRRRLRQEYDEARQETDPERIAFLLRLAETQLETVEVHAEHLSSIFASPDYHRT